MLIPGEYSRKSPTTRRCSVDPKPDWRCKSHAHTLRCEFTHLPKHLQGFEAGSHVECFRALLLTGFKRFLALQHKRCTLLRGLVQL